MSFLKNFLKKEEYTGLLFEDNKIKIIKIQKKNDDFFPVYWNILDFNLNGLLEKTEMIDFFKKIQSNLKTKKINLEIKSDDKNSKEIFSNLKIAGFEEINFIDSNYNIDNLVIDKETLEETIFALFEKEKIILNYVKENHIYNKKEVEFKKLNQEAIQKLFQNIDYKHIFISGDFEDKLDKIKEIFYKEKIKTHIFNPWKNILSFKTEIPALFKNESHKYLKVLSLTLPPLEEIPFIKENTEEKKKTKNKKEIIKNKEEEKENEEINLDFILDNKKEPEIILEDHTIWQKIKDFFNKVILGPKEAKSFKAHCDENSILNKQIYLPKPKIKLYLPKPKKKIFLENSKSFKLIENKKTKKRKEKEKQGKKDEKKKELKNKKKEKKKNKKDRRKNSTQKEKKIFLKKPFKKIFLKKPKKKIFLPKPKKNDFWKKVWNFLIQPVFEKETKNKKEIKK